MFSFGHCIATLVFSIACYCNYELSQIDPIITLLGISFILGINYSIFLDSFSILRMKAGRDSEMNKMKIEILKISLIDEVIDLKTSPMCDGQKALIAHLKLNDKMK